MSSSKSSPKRSKKASSNRALLGYDLLYQLSYMAAVSSTGIPRDEIFARAAALPSTAAMYFREVENLVNSLRYRYSEACQIVGERAKEPEIKSLLMRMASFLASGEPERVFMGHEAKIQADAYQNVYEGSLETLKKWTDAFAALAVSSALIVVVATISTVIFDLGSPFVIGLIFIMLCVNGMGVWILSKACPREIKILQAPDGLYAQRRPRRLVFILTPAAVILTILMIAGGMNLGFALMVCGVLIYPVGYFASRFDASVTKLDKDVAAFLRVLGSTAAAVGTTPGEALGKMDMRSVASLAPLVEQLHINLKSQARPELCWKRFVDETGSEVIRRCVHIFTDGIYMGGVADEVGIRASFVATQVEFLRAKRRQITQTFGWLTLAMHSAVVFLLMFVVEIVGGFGDLVSNAGVNNMAQTAGAQDAAALTFNFGNMGVLRELIIPVVIALAITNAMAPQVADGGYGHKFFFYFSLTIISSGAAILIAPMMGDLIFSSAQQVPSG